MGTTSAGLTTSLRTLVNALQTNQSALSYVSDNISNVNTKGYTRRIVAQETQVSSGTGVGVGIAEIRRSVDDFLIKSMRNQLSKVGQANVTNTYFDRLQQFSFGNPGSDFTINNTLNQFYTRLDSLAGDASSAVKRNLAVSSSKDFTNTVSELANSIQNERYNADSEISTSINSINSIIENIYDINISIRQAIAVGGDVNSLYDARDVQINNLEEQMDVEVTIDANGAATININSTELVGSGGRYRLSYDRASSVDIFKNGNTVSAITATLYDNNDTATVNTTTLLSASNATNQVDVIPNGKLRGLIDIRDTKLPRILDQLDIFAYTFANEFNAIHNSGTGYPPPSSLTGVTTTTLSESRNYSGQTRISLVNSTGGPVLGRFGEQLPPLTIDFDRLNGGDGYGTATTQSIINEINSYYGSQPATAVNVGPAYDIRLGAVSSSITSAEASGSMAFSSNPADGDTIILNGVTFTILDSPVGATDIQRGSSLSETLDNIIDTLNTSSNSSINVATYSYIASTLYVNYDAAGTTGNSYTLNAGTSPATASGATLSGGANASGNFQFDFDFSNLSTAGNNITFDVTQFKINAGAFSAATFNTYTQNAGERFRTHVSGGTNDMLTASLTGLGLEEGDSFTITATIVVDDGDGGTHTEDVTFSLTVPDPNEDIRNTRYAATAISGSGDGDLVSASSQNALITASLVDEDGNEISDDSTEGFLKITTSSSSYRISIDQLNSSEDGLVGTNASASATGRGFSHYFGLNNFFTYGSGLSGAALNMNIRSDILTNPSLLSTGKVKQSISTGNDTIYTYELGAGSNESVLDLLRLQNTNLSFDAAGGLPELSTTINFYASEIYNYAAGLANTAKSTADKETLLKEALDTKIDDVSGVNLDEELAQTIQIQNTYSAAAKVLGIVRELFSKIEEVLV